MFVVHLIKGIRDRAKDPHFLVELERERSRPGYRRRQTLRALALLLLVAALVFFWWLGWELPSL